MTRSATAEALAQILGRRIDKLESAIREAIASLEHDEESRASGSVQYVIDGLREAL